MKTRKELIDLIVKLKNKLRKSGEDDSFDYEFYEDLIFWLKQPLQINPQLKEQPSSITISNVDDEEHRHYVLIGGGNNLAINRKVTDEIFERYTQDEFVMDKARFWQAVNQIRIENKEATNQLSTNKQKERIMLPERDHSISDEKAAEMINKLAMSKAEGLLPREFQFHNDQVKKLTETKDAKVFVITPAKDEAGNYKVVLSVRNEKMEDIPGVKLELSFP